MRPVEETGGELYLPGPLAVILIIPWPTYCAKPTSDEPCLFHIRQART